MSGAAADRLSILIICKAGHRKPRATGEGRPSGLSPKRMEPNGDLITREPTLSRPPSYGRY